jgi:hypothetical protein
MGALDRLYEHDVAATEECERLRGLLAIARGALVRAGETGLEFDAPMRFHDEIMRAWCRSDPDAAPGDES